ncbi:unnamed protein product [Owenia fusiformis]|uniref:G-protein coupled receptors family 1 profile domain-containing protein n=1 Tax=Owenia fusiformis TaxID=6347 RepID=A0A8S4NY27_OWEFU|nr:unnamed protein product [Owenia fusiformis]
MSNSTNVSNLSFAQNASSFEQKYTPVETALIVTVLGTIIFMSIAGNTLVCIAIFTDRALRRTNNLFLVSLAVADMMVATLVMTFAVANDVMGYWWFNIEFCNVWISFDIICSTASILNLCAISLDRYIHIRNPLHYEMWMTKKKLAFMITSVWLCSALLGFVPINMGWHRIGMEDISTNHHDSQICQMELNPTYAVVSSFISFYLPCIVMVTIYIQLFRYAQKHVKSIRKMDRLNQVASNGTKTHTSYKVSDHKAARTLGIIMGVFLLCWVPFFTINIISSFCPTCIPVMLFNTFTWLGYSNSSLNPIIYSIFNQEFREAFRKILCLHRCPKISSQLNIRKGGSPYKDKDTAPYRDTDIVRFNDVSSDDIHLNNSFNCASSLRKGSRGPLMEKITTL